MGRRTRGVAVLHDVEAAVDPGALAVPHGKDAVIFGVRILVELLRAPDGGHRQVLVQARLELDVILVEELLGPPEILVDAAEGRAAIARDEAARLEAGRRIALLLHDRQAHQRLDTREIDPAAFQRVFVVEADGLGDGKRHEMQSLP